MWGKVTPVCCHRDPWRSLTEGGDCMWVALDRARGKKVLLSLNVRLLSVRAAVGCCFLCSGLSCFARAWSMQKFCPTTPSPPKFCSAALRYTARDLSLHLTICLLLPNLSTQLLGAPAQASCCHPPTGTFLTLGFLSKREVSCRCISI